jgi:hypothetical protein
MKKIKKIISVINFINKNKIFISIPIILLMTIFYGCSFTYYQEPQKKSFEYPSIIYGSCETVMSKTMQWGISKNLSPIIINEKMMILVFEGNTSSYQSDDIDFFSGKQKTSNAVADCGECGEVVKYNVIPLKFRITITYKKATEDSTNVNIGLNFNDFDHADKCKTIHCISTGLIEQDLINYLTKSKL